MERFRKIGLINLLAIVTYIKLGCEIQDIDIELRVNLWDGGLTSNYFSMISDRKDIECFIYIYVT